MPRFGSDDGLKCSFCGKAQQQVAKIIAGPGVFICDECIDLCNEIIEDEVGDRPNRRPLDADVQAAARAAMSAVERLRILAERALAREPAEPE